MFKKITIIGLFILLFSSLSIAVPNLQTHNPDKFNFHPSPTGSITNIDNPNYNGYLRDNFTHGDDFQFIFTNDPSNDSDNPPPSVPEPTTMILFGLGMAGAAVVRKFKK